MLSQNVYGPGDASDFFKIDSFGLFRIKVYQKFLRNTMPSLRLNTHPELNIEKDRIPQKTLKLKNRRIFSLKKKIVECVNS